MAIFRNYNFDIDKEVSLRDLRIQYIRTGSAMVEIPWDLSAGCVAMVRSRLIHEAGTPVSTVQMAIPRSVIDISGSMIGSYPKSRAARYAVRDNPSLKLVIFAYQRELK